MKIKEMTRQHNGNPGDVTERAIVLGNNKSAWKKSQLSFLIQSPVIPHPCPWLQHVHQGSLATTEKEGIRPQGPLPTTTTATRSGDNPSRPSSLLLQHLDEGSKPSRAGDVQ
jgi:hypothetical protein